MFDVCVLNAGPIAPQPQPELPISPVDRIVMAEMQRLTPLYRLRILTPLDIRDSLYIACGMAQSAYMAADMVMGAKK